MVHSISDKLNDISLYVCLLLEKEGYLAIPIPVIEAVFDEKTGQIAFCTDDFYHD